MIESYIRGKKHVAIKLAGLDNGATKQNYGSFILNNLEKMSENDYEPQNKANKVESNLISSSIFKTLPNIKSMSIDSAGKVDGCSKRLSN